MLFLYAHNNASEGAKALTEALEIRRIRHENSRFRGGPRKTVINWGSSTLNDEIQKSTVLNSANAVGVAANKRTFFRTFGKDSQVVPPWTESFEEAVAWTAESDVCARTVLTGSSAEGLVIMTRDNPQGFVRAPLYVKYIKKTEEYRVHVAFGQVIDVQRKVLSKEKAESGEQINWKIRNLDNGFIFQRNNINPHESVTQVALQAVQQVGLDFGAVDIIWNDRQRRAYVLEINTAPGLVGTTVENYANVFRRFK